jgi:hypothetical protein
LATGFLFLLWGAKKGEWWMFGIVGLVAGLGFTIRPECAQLVIYSILWLLVRLIRPKSNMGRLKLLCALFILLIGLTFPVIPYVAKTGKIVPQKLEELLDQSKEHITRFLPSQSKEEPQVDSHRGIRTAVSLLRKVIKAIGRLTEEISDNLMYFFAPALLIGFYCRFRKQPMATDIERFFIPVFTVLNVIIMILLYCGYGYISRRHCLPLTVFLILYVPEGLNVLAVGLENKFSKTQPESNRHPRLFFFILLVIGLSICLPKLLRPIRVEKQGYIAASKWLSENTGQEDIIAVPDLRISFYAERKGVIYKKEIPGQTMYVVRIAENGSEGPDFDRVLQEEYSVSVDKRKKSGKKLVIYKAQ